MVRELFDRTQSERSVIAAAEAGQLLRKYGKFEEIRLSSGETITILPTCTTPTPYLDKNNWRETVPMGNFRSVYSVDHLTDGTNPKIVVKSSEKVFTQDKKLLEAGYPWWGGTRTLEKKVRILDNPVVEAQSIWEAIVLLELHKNGIRAEVPQALIESNKGKLELVVNCIEEPSFFESINSNGHSISSEEIFLKTGLICEDYPSRNILRDKDGYSCIIDVNRWSWPPYMDKFRQSLLNVVRQAS